MLLISVLPFLPLPPPSHTQIPVTREVLASLPNVLGAMCLNTRGLQTFLDAKPFDHLFGVLISPQYLSAMRRKKGTDQMGEEGGREGKEGEREGKEGEREGMNEKREGDEGEKESGG